MNNTTVSNNTNTDSLISFLYDLFNFQWMLVVSSKMNKSAGIDTLESTMKTIQSKIQQLQEECEHETYNIEHWMIQKNRAEAMKCLRRRKILEQNIVQYQKQLLNLQRCQIQKENKELNTQYIDTLKMVRSEMKTHTNDVNLDEIHDIMDDHIEAMGKQEDINALMGMPLEYSQLDEKELEQELDEYTKNMDQRNISYEQIPFDHAPLTSLKIEKHSLSEQQHTEIPIRKNLTNDTTTKNHKKVQEKAVVNDEDEEEDDDRITSTTRLIKQ